jgi:hypothetical protein
LVSPSVSRSNSSFKHKLSVLESFYSVSAICSRCAICILIDASDSIGTLQVVGPLRQHRLRRLLLKNSLIINRLVIAKRESENGPVEEAENCNDHTTPAPAPATYPHLATICACVGHPSTFFILPPWLIQLDPPLHEHPVAIHCIGTTPFLSDTTPASFLQTHVR